MATPGTKLVRALRRAAARIESGAGYRWSNFGMCNCGHLVQSLTTLTPEQIHRIGFAGTGDWGRQARDYCSTSGYPMDWLLGRLFEAGLTAEDVHHLERLSGPEVLARLPAERRPLAHHRAADVVVYLRAWADLLEAELSDTAGERRAVA